MSRAALSVDDVVTAADSLGAWAAAQGVGRIMDAWPSGYLRDTARGPDWDIAGPGVTADVYVPDEVRISNGQQTVVESAAFAGAAVSTTASADLVSFDVVGRAHVNDGAVDLSGFSGLRCTRVGGCACPDSDEEPPDQLSSPFVIAVTNGSEAGAVTMHGLSLEDYCEDQSTSWSFAVFQFEATVPSIAGYTCDGLDSTWHVIFGPGTPLLERTYDLAFSPSVRTVHHDLIYDLPPDGLSSAVHVEWRLDYFMDTAVTPPMIRVTGTQHETQGGSAFVVESNFGLGDGITLENVSLSELLAGRGLSHPFLTQAMIDCG